jgi:hypothetical protein
VIFYPVICRIGKRSEFYQKNTPIGNTLSGMKDDFVVDFQRVIGAAKAVATAPLQWIIS